MPDDMSSQKPKPLIFDEIITSRGLRVPFVPSIITPNIERPLRNSRYEAGEQQHLETLIRPDDRVLDLGGGLGLVAATAARLAPQGRVLSIEAHPDLLPMIREVWTLNGVENAELRHGLITADGGETRPFYMRHDFWASSTEPDSRPYVATKTVATLSLPALIAEFQPTVICCDVEGAELDLFDDVDLTAVRAIVLETHPKVYGVPARDALLKSLSDTGLETDPTAPPSTVFVLQRAATKAVPSTPSNPRILLATCMKDEGPFILEWLAWHKAAGVTDFVIFSNDCTDGTDALLDHLDARGDITHLPNPATITGSTYYQPAALNFVQSMPVFRAADYMLSIDVDEFLNIRIGDGTLSALLEAVDPFDVMSICELNHGTNDHETFQPGWVTDLFPAHDTPRPGRWRAGVGVKSLTRLSPRIASIRNHRPDLAVPPQDVVWRDGSGNPMSDLAEDPQKNGIDSRGKRALVSLEHYPLRSIDSFLVKAWRGDVVIKGKQVSNAYFRRRNRNSHNNMDIPKGQSRARDAYKLFEQDLALMALHDACVTAHQTRIDTLKSDPDYRERRAEIVAIAAEQKTPPPVKGTDGDTQDDGAKPQP